jgi:hypothetical protein
MMARAQTFVSARWVRRSEPTQQLADMLSRPLSNGPQAFTESQPTAWHRRFGTPRSAVEQVIGSLSW